MEAEGFREALERRVSTGNSRRPARSSLVRPLFLVAPVVVAGTARGADGRALAARERALGVTIRDAFGDPLVEPRPVSLGAWASRAAQMTSGELVDGTPMVSPADLVRSGKLVRVVDELHP